MQFEDIIYEKKDGVAWVTINRPQVLNAFRTKTMQEMVVALQDAERNAEIGVVVLTGAGERAFCVGGDAAEVVGKAGYSRDLVIATKRVHHLIRHIPQPVIAAVNGWSIGGGNVLQVICDLTIASETARFGQVGPRVGSFDAGFASAYLGRVVGEKKAREIWYLCRTYTAQEALQMGMVNKVVPPDKLKEEVETWCQEILAKSPFPIRFLKTSFNADSDNIAGIDAMAVEALWNYYGTEEALEGRKAFLDRREPDFSRFRKEW